MARERAKLDHSRPYQEITGEGRTHVYEQDNKRFDGEGVEITRQEYLDKLQAQAPTGVDAEVKDLQSRLANANLRIDELTRDRDDLKLQLADAKAAGGDTAAIEEMQRNIDAANQLIEEQKATIADQERELQESADALEKVVAQTNPTTKVEVTPTAPELPTSPPEESPGSPTPPEQPAPPTDTESSTPSTEAPASTDAPPTSETPSEPSADTTAGGGS